MGERKADIAFWALLLAMHAAFFAFQLDHDDPYLSDSYEYLSAAGNLAQRGVLYAGSLAEPVDPALYTKRPPLYPLFLAIAGAHTGKVWIALLLQNVLSLLNLYLVLSLFGRMGGEKRMSWAILVFVALFPSQLVYANMIMSEMLLQTFITAAFYTLARYLLEDGEKHLLAYHLLIAAAAMTKPVMYLFVVPNTVLMMVLGLSRRDTRPVLYSLLPLLAVAGYCAWNAVRTGLFHFSSIQSASLLDYNTRYFLVQQEGSTVADRLVGAVHLRAEEAATFAERQRILHAGAWELIRPRWFPYVIFHLRGALAFFLDPGRFDLYHFFGISSGGEGLLPSFSRGGVAGIWTYLRTQPAVLVAGFFLIAAANMVRLAGLVVAAFARIPGEVKAGLLLLIGYAALVTGPVGSARFAVPVFPLTLLGALLALDHVRNVARRTYVRRSPT